MSLRRALVLVVLLAVTLSGCSILYPTPDATMWEPLPTVQVDATAVASPTATATEPPPATATLVPDPTSLAQETAAKAAWARDVVWAYLVQVLEDSDLTAAPTWVMGDTIQAEGATRYRYLADSWAVTVSVPAGPLGEAVCEATLAGPADFDWTARVDTQGNVQGEKLPAYATHTPQATASPTATCTPAATETLIPTPTVALTQTAVLTSTIAPTQTAASTPTRKSAWTSTPVPTQTSAATQTAAPTQTPAPTGTAAPTLAAAPTYTAAPTQTLAVTPPPVATPVPASEVVEGWVGQISTLDVGARYDDYFLVDGNGARYGVASLVPRIAQELASYRDTGTRLRVWGMLDYGVEDYGGRRIVVGRYEVAN